MIEPWLLMTEEERRERAAIYNDLVSPIHPPVDELLVVMFRPPRTALDARLELWLYQLRAGKEKLNV